jgi:hypothetical protein
MLVFATIFIAVFVLRTTYSAYKMVIASLGFIREGIFMAVKVAIINSFTG